MELSYGKQLIVRFVVGVGKSDGKVGFGIYFVSYETGRVVFGG